MREVLASNYPGGREMFIAQMNLKAQSLGLVVFIPKPYRFR
jgi:D-alanyl-D-alanine carboxypeptidase